MNKTQTQQKLNQRHISLSSNPPLVSMGSQLSNAIDGKDNTKTIGSADPDQLMEIESLEKILNYKFKDKSLLLKAFTDASYVDDKSESYELLELLGDSILNMGIIYDFIKLYPKEAPGPLTKLRAVNVDTEKLARVAVNHQLYSYLRHKKPLLEEQVSYILKNPTQLSSLKSLVFNRVKSYKFSFINYFDHVLFQFGSLLKSMENKLCQPFFPILYITFIHNLSQ